MIKISIVCTRSGYFKLLVFFSRYNDPIITDSQVQQSGGIICYVARQLLYKKKSKRRNVRCYGSSAYKQSAYNTEH